jgi:hypothetical protein
MPDDLPDWFLALRGRYLAGDASVFAVDAPPGAAVGAPAGAAAPLVDAVIACLSASREQVFSHDVLGGLRGLTPAARAHRQELPGDPLEALRRLLANPRGSAAIVLAHADLTLPSGPGAGEAQRQAELLLRQALDSPDLRRSDHVVVLTLPTGARLPPALAAHPRLVRLSAGPPPAAAPDVPGHPTGTPGALPADPPPIPPQEP